MFPQNASNGLSHSRATPDATRNTLIDGIHIPIYLHLDPVMHLLKKIYLNTSRKRNFAVKQTSYLKFWFLCVDFKMSANQVSSFCICRPIKDIRLTFSILASGRGKECKKFLCQRCNQQLNRATSKWWSPSFSQTTPYPNDCDRRCYSKDPYLIPVQLSNSLRELVSS